MIEDLEAEQQFQDAVLTVLHAFTHTFAMAGNVAKIVENHIGRAFMTNRPIPQHLIPGAAPVQGPPLPPQAP